MTIKELMELDYYSRLIGTLGGKVSAYYLDGMAVYHHGSIEGSKENIIKDQYAKSIVDFLKKSLQIA